MESSLARPTNEAQNLPSGDRLAGFTGLIQRVEQTAAERAKAADKLVRGHPYQTIGLVLGLGALIGVIVGRKWRA
jgi:ElaB/YqjD/DUF883 family membrane-anchored ribosome-binding protein